MSRFPWGTGKAPALACDDCNHRIGANRSHTVLLDGDLLLCPRCLHSESSTQSRASHARHYPDCPHTWHDMFDHHGVHATRAGAWHALTDPESRRA